MAIVESKKFLKTLIQSGADANLNLFEVSFLPSNKELSESTLSVRTTHFAGVVTRDSNTVSLPYQNIEILKVSPGTNIIKTQSFSIRVDEDYSVLQFLRAYQCIDDSGYYVENKNKKFTNITVRALKPMVNTYYKDNFCTVYEWVFYDCYITAISPVEFDYSSANPASVTVTFVWGDYAEHSLQSNETPTQISAQDVSSGISGILNDLIDGKTTTWDSIMNKF